MHSRLSLSLAITGSDVNNINIQDKSLLYHFSTFCLSLEDYIDYIQSALVISNFKVLSEIHRDTRTSTY